MIRLLRSTIDFDGQISSDHLIQNFQKLLTAKIEWVREDDARIFKYLQTYFQDQMDLPSGQTLHDHFEGLKDVEVVERLKDIKVAPSYVRSNYVHLLKTLLEEQNKVKAKLLLQKVHEIITRGAEVQKGEHLQGVRDGLIYFAQQTSDLIVPDFNAKLHGDVRNDGQEMVNEYTNAETNKGKVWGKFCGLRQIDEACRGIKRGELWIHAGFPGELKTSFAINWAYNLVTHYATNVVYISLEMPYEQVRRNIYTVHTSHERWLRRGRKPLDYRKIRDGELSEEEKKFYFEEVIPDFCQNPNYCHFEVVTPDREMTMDDIRMQVELFHKQYEVGLIVIDHGQWVEARKAKRNKDYVTELNSVVRDAKRMALHFNHREGVPVLLLFQINRQGKDDADKADGVYKMKALTYANECLVEGTLVTSKRGFVPIESIRVGDEVWSSTGWKPVLDVFDQGVRPIFEVRTRSGLCLQGTHNHRLRTLAEDGQVHWTTIGDLTPGQFLLKSSKPNPLPTELPELPPLEIGFHEKPNGDQGIPLRVPKTLTPGLAYLMGAYLGDGVKGSTYRIGFTGNREETQVRDKIVKEFQDTFGHSLGCTEAPSRPGSFDLTKWSKSLKRWFLKVGLTREAGIPSCMMSASEYCVAAFLRGLFDTDGSVNNQGHVTVSLASRYRQTLQQVQLLARTLGIETALSDGRTKLKGKVYGRTVLRVKGHASLLRFSTKVGFTESHKSGRLREILQGVSLSRVNRREGWPVKSLYVSLVNKYRGEVRLPRCVMQAAVSYRKKKGVCVGVGPLSTLVSALSEVEDQQVTHLQNLLGNFQPDEVLSVTPVGDASVWDIEVSGDHEYEAGGLLSHNCEKTADVITTTYLNDDHRKNGTTKFTNLKNRDNPIFDPFIARVDFPCRRIVTAEPFNLPSKGMRTEDQEALFQGLSQMM